MSEPMTKNNEQRIINGIDASGCPYYCGHDICKNTCHYFATPCEWVDTQNCTYKQLKRKEQECEELKSTNKIYEQGMARLKDEKNNLKKENNSLKETIDGLLSIQYKLADNCVKYSQTLAEIKELLLKTPTDSQAHCVNAKSVILQKINEVINEN